MSQSLIMDLTSNVYDVEYYFMILELYYFRHLIFSILVGVHYGS